MRLVAVTPPDDRPLSLAETKQHLRVDAADDDERILALIETATLHVDGRDGWLGRALITQVWKATLDAFPAGDRAILLPLPPLQSVDSVSYVDPDGATQTMLPADYETDPGGLRPSRIWPAFNKCWPSTRAQRGAVEVTYTAGYGDSAMTVPQPIRQGLLLMVGHWYENREAVTTQSGPRVDLPMGVESLMAPYRLIGFE